MHWKEKWFVPPEDWILLSWGLVPCPHSDHFVVKGCCVTEMVQTSWFWAVQDSTCTNSDLHFSCVVSSSPWGSCGLRKVLVGVKRRYPGMDLRDGSTTHQRCSSSLQLTWHQWSLPSFSQLLGQCFILEAPPARSEAQNWEWMNGVVLGLLVLNNQFQSFLNQWSF